MDEFGMDDEAPSQTPTTHQKYVYASDGTRFNNSVPGRANLARYEEEKKRVK